MIRPTANLAELRLLIKQKAGEPFSASAVLESVAALQQRHEFSQVQVSIDSQISGLQVIFYSSVLLLPWNAFLSES